MLDQVFYHVMQTINWVKVDLGTFCCCISKL